MLNSEKEKIYLFLKVFFPAIHIWTIFFTPDIDFSVFFFIEYTNWICNHTALLCLSDIHTHSKKKKMIGEKQCIDFTFICR